MTERGVALAGAMLTLAIVGVVVSAVFLLGLQEERMGLSMRRQQEAFTAAERAAHQTAAAWKPEYSLMAGGSAHRFEGMPGGESGWHRVLIRRLNGRLYLVLAEGFSRDSAARQAVGVLLRLTPVSFPVHGALQTAGPVELATGTEVSGSDVTPSGWAGCPASSGNVPGIADPVDSGAVIDAFRVRTNSVLSGGRYQIEPHLEGPVCDTRVPTNWGDPLFPSGPCGSYFPVVWVEGDLTVTGGRGQGVLIVLGDLELAGGFEFYGAVWVRGALRTSGAGARIRGTVVASSARLHSDPIRGGPVIAFSGCSVSRALAFSASATRIGLRGWLELF